MEEYDLSSVENIKSVAVPFEEIEKQREYIQLVRSIVDRQFTESPKAFVHTYGCQGNVSDGERLEGMLEEMGYRLVDELEGADLVLYNTCAIREHAEDRVFGNVGSLKNMKSANRNMKILLCGCMMQQEHVAQKIRKSYPFVDIVFGTHVIHRLPEFLYTNLSKGKKVCEIPDENGVIAEELPVHRDSNFKAWLPVMYGCNNFCSYCIVPYVRGRERSRDPELIVAEAKQLVEQGYKEITLLGQNVNSYGKNPDYGCNFSELLRRINAIDGDFIIRFMTSHPKDCTYELLDTMASCEKVAKHLHLPFQSGSNRVLDAMNRRYTREKYLDLLDYAYRKMPELSVTSDVIVGFPGETYEEFRETVTLVEEAKFTSMYTFIFSSREGTVASKMPDPVSREEKGRWFRELLDAQEVIAAKRTASMVGKTYKVLCESVSKGGLIEGRTQGNIIIEFPADISVIGTFKDVKVTESLTWILKGELI
ncbi:MAG: tRNA (N6-isopentenyl adenosine(37)-C2)-methylthiotransferase MiaB [Clostridia bacterium]|nr:tRNA (N6-isopentenyl adenosine(37)-C2)-methylthiotransferase MiaB [Clostridia bacterium]